MPSYPYALTFSNPSFTTDVSGWTTLVGNALVRIASGGHTGAYARTGSQALVQAGTVVDLPSDALSDVDLGRLKLDFSHWANGFTADDELGSASVEFYSSTGATSGDMIGMFAIDWTNWGTTWVQKTGEMWVPPGARSIRVTIRSKRFSGTNNDTYIDDFEASLATRTKPHLQLLWLKGNETAGWTKESGAGTIASGGNWDPWSDGYGGTGLESIVGSGGALVMYRDLDLTGLSATALADIDAGTATVEYTTQQGNFDGNDAFRGWIQALDSGGSSLGTVVQTGASATAISDQEMPKPWRLTGTLPAGTRTLRLRHQTTLVTGSNADAYGSRVSVQLEASEIIPSGSVGAVAGTSTVAGVGAPIGAGVGAAPATGVAAGVGVGITTTESTGTATGTSTVAGDGAGLASGYAIGEASGTGTATGVGARTVAAVGEAEGYGEGDGVGGEGGGNVGSAVGTSTAAATSYFLSSSVGSAVGTSTGDAGGATVQFVGVGSASGTSAASGAGSKVRSITGTSFAAGVALGRSASFSEAVGASSGTSTVVGAGVAAHAAVGAAAGAGDAEAQSDAVNAGKGKASGTLTVLGVGTRVRAYVGTASGSSTVAGRAASIFGSIGSSTGVGTAQSPAVGYASAVGASSAASTGAALSTVVAAGRGRATAVGLATSNGERVYEEIPDGRTIVVGAFPNTIIVSRNLLADRTLVVAPMPRDVIVPAHAATIAA